MKAEDAEALRATGLAHLLAISGLHLSIVGGLVFLLVKRALVLIEPIALRVAVQKPAAVVALIACLAYLIVSGASVSTQRAFIMAAIVFGAVIFDRAAISLRTFAIAMIAVVMLQPESVVTTGFQMSFAATGALIAAYQIWRDHRSGQEQVMGPFAFSWASIAVTSAVAGLATMPFALFHFDRAITDRLCGQSCSHARRDLFLRRRPLQSPSFSRRSALPISACACSDIASNWFWWWRTSLRDTRARLSAPGNRCPLRRSCWRHLRSALSSL